MRTAKETAGFFEIFIQAAELSGLSFALEVQNSESIGAVIAKIRTRFPCYKSVERVEFAVEELEECRRLSDYAIKKESTLDLVLAPSSEIAIRAELTTRGA